MLDQYNCNDFLSISSKLPFLYKWLCFYCEKQNQLSEMIWYGILALRAEPYESFVLMKIFALLKRELDEEKTQTILLAFYQSFMTFPLLRIKRF